MTWVVDTSVLLDISQNDPQFGLAAVECLVRHLSRYSGAPFSNRAFNLRLRAACRAAWGEGGYRPGVATFHRKDLREIQELLRNKNIRATARYTHVLSQALE